MVTITIDNIDFYNDFNPDSTPFLMGAVGDMSYVGIDFSIQWSTLNTAMVFTNGTNTIVRTDCIKGFNSFINDGFVKGDIIVISTGTSIDGTYSIASINDSTIITNESITSSVSVSSANIYGVTPIEIIDFYYNLIGSNGQNSFSSLTDPTSIQRYTGTGTTASPFSLNPVGKSKAWTIGDVDGNDYRPKVANTTINPKKQTFTLSFGFLITPLFLINQIGIMKDNKFQPSYFTKQCLKFIYKLGVRTSIPSATTTHTSQNFIYENSNTCWFNTFFPTGLFIGSDFITEPVIDITDVEYKDSYGNKIDSLSLNGPTSVVVSGENNTGATVSNSQYVLNFMWLPPAQLDYQVSPENMRDLLLHDRVFDKIDSLIPSNGDKYGTVTQAIVGLTSSSISNEFKLYFDIDFGSESLSKLMKDGNYVLWITQQNVGITSSYNSDRSAVTIDINNAGFNVSDSTLLNILDTTNILYSATSSTLSYSYGWTYSGTFSTIFSSNVAGINPITIVSNSVDDFNYSLMSSINGLYSTKFIASGTSSLLNLTSTIPGIEFNDKSIQFTVSGSASIIGSDTATFSGGVNDYPSPTGSVYFYNDIVLGTSSLSTEYYKGSSGNYGLMECDFSVRNGCSITSINVVTEIEIYDSNGLTASSPLESWNNSTSGYYDGNVTQIDILYNNNYNIPSTDLRNYRSITRVDKYDTMTYSSFNLSYGFQVGYQFWQQLNYFSKYYTDYHTNYWPAYTQNILNGTNTPILPIGMSSSIKMKIVFDILDTTTGFSTIYERINTILAIDSLSTNPNNKVVLSTVDELGNSLGGGLSMVGPTTITAVYTGELSPPIGLTTSGEFSIYYSNPNNNIYDKLNTLDTTIETVNSLWIPPLIISKSTDGSSITLIGKFDASQSKLPLSNMKIYTKLFYN